MHAYFHAYFIRNIRFTKRFQDNINMNAKQIRCDNVKRLIWNRMKSIGGSF